VTRRTFPNTPAAVSAARHFALDAIGDVPAPVLDAVAVGVSELATNCVRHARTEFSVDVEQTPERLRVEVSDFGAGMPVVRSPDPWVPTGRGLRLVSTFADEWGVRSHEDRSGKSVWFAIDLSKGISALDDTDRG
jgi:serine/threonine-protein kinase RsbW